MPDESRRVQLIRKRLREGLAEQEEAELRMLSRQSPEDQVVLDIWTNPEEASRCLKAYGAIDDLAILDNADEASRPSGRQVRIRINRYKVGGLFGAAAMIPLILTYFLSPSVQSEFSITHKNSLALIQPMEPDIQSPTLTVRCDSVYALDKPGNGRLLQLGRWSSIKQDDKQIAFLRASDPTSGYHLPDSCLIKFSNPTGDILRILLPDKSKLSLGAHSSVSFYLFPADTVPRNRVLVLMGEARFDVSRNKRIPFRVETKRTETIVLGTGFTVYDDGHSDSMVVNTYSGKVSVTNGRSRKTLSAGQKATLLALSDSIPVIKDLPVPDSTTQESDLFNFSRMRLPEAMEEIRKWYGMSRVRFEAEVDTLSIGKLNGGRMPKNLPLYELLHHFWMSDLKFRIRGQTIIVYSKDTSRNSASGRDTGWGSSLSPMP